MTMIALILKNALGLLLVTLRKKKIVTWFQKSILEMASSAWEKLLTMPDTLTSP